ncbi:hypothetical protein FW774_00255 (plasmid) [Pedobacter sp. BS3]|uniref:hypothetical protein n=1 Tax=Pedobacter sp. BS3 TaxID=2567937 RepID=UPI0011ED76A0|nr:hypothetical protein [Pedobacter sp. BS3]TZF85550.1 hypothetical protein FW774_00255 [Pedobacter sp. BS3]
MKKVFFSAALVTALGIGALSAKVNHTAIKNTTTYQDTTKKDTTKAPDSTQKAPSDTTAKK